MVMLIRAGSGVLRPVWSSGDPGGGPSNPAGRPSSSSSPLPPPPSLHRRRLRRRQGRRGRARRRGRRVPGRRGRRRGSSGSPGPSSSQGRGRRRRVVVAAGVAVVGVGVGLGFGGRRGEAVPGAALVDAVHQDHRPDLGQGAGQARVAEPDRLGVDRRLPRQRLGRVQLPPRQARRPGVLPAQLDPPVAPGLVLPPWTPSGSRRASSRAAFCCRSASRSPGRPRPGPCRPRRPGRRAGAGWRC